MKQPTLGGVLLREFRRSGIYDERKPRRWQAGGVFARLQHTFLSQRRRGHMNGALTLITTALSSGIAAAIFSSALTEGRDRWELRRKKIEEIYKQVKLHHINIDDRLDALAAYAGRKVNYAAYLNHLNENLTPPDSISMRMNISLYETDLTEFLDSYTAVCSSYSGLADVYVVQRMTGDNELEDLGRRVAAFRAEVQARAAALMIAIEQRGREIASEPGQIGRWLRIAHRKVVGWRQASVS